jgi:penicillin-binding protein 2
MQNRLTSPLIDEPRGGWTPVREVDRSPVVRLLMLLGAFVVPLMGIGWRVAHLQTALVESYAEAFDVTSERSESMATWNGRILTSDGVVLAEDVEVFGITAHYRWLEEPPNEEWLEQLAKSKLTRPERRKRELVEAEIEKVRLRQQELWQRLAHLTETTPEELTKARSAVQRRIERIRRSVAEKQERRRLAAQTPQKEVVSTGRWNGAWDAVRRALTTPPQRSAEQPLVIQEELDYHPVCDDVPLEVAAEIEAHPELYPGLRVRMSTRRTYPQGDLAPHIVGSRLPLDPQQIAERRERLDERDPLDYQPGDWAGRSGIERYYEQHLRGLRGERKLVLNRRGEVIRNIVARRPRAGHDLVLTLHAPLQRETEKLLDKALAATPTEAGAEPPAETPRGGCIVLMDVRTGDLLAAAAAPRFDLNILINHDDEAWQRVLDDPRRPLFPRLTQMALPPGSTFKTLTAAAALQSGRLDPHERLECHGFLTRPDRQRCYIYRHFGVGHGPTDLTTALAQSCNVYFYTVARQMGPDPICEWAQRFGYGRPTGVDLPDERGGNLPAPGESTGPGNSRHKWQQADTLDLAIGQSTLTATPLQVVRMMAAVANGGELVTPRFAQSLGPVVRRADSDESLAIESEVNRVPGLDSETLSYIREGLKQCVAHPRGTGYKTVRLTETAIAGKTGTAEVGGKPDHAWFAGYVPVDRPRYAFVVVLEHAGSGGKAAGPVARDLVRAMLRERLIGETSISQK